MTADEVPIEQADEIETVDILSEDLIKAVWLNQQLVYSPSIYEFVLVSGESVKHAFANLRKNRNGTPGSEVLDDETGVITLGASDFIDADGNIRDTLTKVAFTKDVEPKQLEARIQVV